MNLIALAVPFFLLALTIELLLDKARGTGFYRLNDAINSLNAGTLNVTTGYFTRFLAILLWGLVLEHLAIAEIPLANFDLSATGLAWWALAIVLWDFCYYWNHRLGHEISILWAAHAVHHQSEEYNLSTALRQTSTGFLFSWVFYVPLFVLGFPVEVLVTANAINLIYQFWVHTRFVDKLGVLDRILVTPSNHRVHHAQNAAYIDKNYGGIFILWDRLFGTFQEELDDEPVIFGVRKPLASWNPFWANVQVYSYLWFDASRTRRWRDKLGIWFRRTGWRPDDVELEWPRTPSDLDRFEKYDPPIASGARDYLLIQFLLLVPVVLGIGVLFARDGAAAVVVPCLWLWSLLFSLGFISDGKPVAHAFELIRLTLITPIAAFASGLPFALPVSAGYALLSLYVFYLCIFRNNKQEVMAEISNSHEVRHDA
ncbi:MAG: sterol desaturase family protein [Woeseiaceae bacterium]|nr:sterol desaturase family protein [Woeseiaceae bacterium]